jgi:pyruvate, water dikinase
MTTSPYAPTDTAAMAECIAWFGDVSRHDVATVGGKGANLGELTRAGFPVPPGFVVTADAYLQALDEAGARDLLRRSIGGGDVDDPAALSQLAVDSQTCVRAAGMPDAVRRAVLDAYARLGHDERVAVRSSATAEDTASTSFAGMNETFTNVHGADELFDRIVDCWASLWSPRVVAYRATQELTDEPAIAVVVQRMVDAARPVSCSPPTPPPAIASEWSSRPRTASARSWWADRSSPTPTS